MTRTTILLFANLRERAGNQRSIEIDLPPQATVQDLKDQVARQFPGLKDMLGSVLVAVDREFAFNETVLRPDAEIALFPPVSGG